MADEERTDLRIESELYAAYPVPLLAATTAPRRPSRSRAVVRRVLSTLQGLCLGLIQAIVTDQLVGLGTPIPMMVFSAACWGWIIPDVGKIAKRAVAARMVVCLLGALPFCWWPR